jgi:hypothetical protein
MILFAINSMEISGILKETTGCNCSTSGKEESKCLPMSCPILQKKSLKQFAVASKDAMFPLSVCK